jgi:uncharacterized protein (TIGR03032 family)
VPVAGHTTGDIDIHDIHAGPDGRPVFVATRFNCLATIAERASFAPVWRPPFIDRLAAEDRCHLNGFAMRDGRPAFATCVAATNVVEGWREHRRDGGRVIDIASGETVAGGVSMPHSPRLRRGRLCLLESGTGEFGHVDLPSGRFEPVCFLQGYARGVAFLSDSVVIGVSRPRENRTFEGLALNERLAREAVGPLCHLAVVNLATGDVEHRLMIEGAVRSWSDHPRPEVASVLSLPEGFPLAPGRASQGAWQLNRASGYFLRIGRSWNGGWRTATRHKSWSGGRGSCSCGRKAPA